MKRTKLIQPTTTGALNLQLRRQVGRCAFTILRPIVAYGPHSKGSIKTLLVDTSQLQKLGWRSPDGTYDGLVAIASVERGANDSASKRAGFSRQPGRNSVSGLRNRSRKQEKVGLRSGCCLVARRAANSLFRALRIRLAGDYSNSRPHPAASSKDSAVVWSKPAGEGLSV